MRLQRTYNVRTFFVMKSTLPKQTHAQLLAELREKNYQIIAKQFGTDAIEFAKKTNRERADEFRAQGGKK